MNCRTSPMVQSYFTAAELAGMPGVPTSVSALIRRAKAEGWDFKKRKGKGGGREYAFASLPQETRDALLERLVDSAEPDHPVQTSTATPTPARKPESYEQLNETQLQVMGARVALVREIERLCTLTTQQKAIQTLVAKAALGDLTPYLAERAVLANDRKTATRNLSERTLKRWLSDFREHGERALAPKRRKADMTVPEWLPRFLKFYQRPQKPPVAAAYQMFVERSPGPHPSIDQVYRQLRKMSPEARERGRMGPRDLKAVQPFKRRTFDHLWPNDVWVGDGHTFKSEVINPITGQAFKPEITMVIDWGTKRIVGVAVNLAESILATLDALRDGITRNGMFAVFYSDNGAGFDNDPVREVVDRLGGTFTNALPYNSQGRGIIERPHQSILIRYAKTLDSYIGPDMDKEAATRVHKLSRQAIKNGLKPLHIPSFQEFYDGLCDAVERYNHTPHSSLPKIRDLETGRMRHQSPMEALASAEAEGWEPVSAEADLVASLTRPQEVRKTHRGEVRINGGIYFLDMLRDFHGEEVKVAWDYRDETRVGVFTLEGELLGEAELNGNATQAMPQSMIQRAADKRAKGQLNRLGTKAKTITGQDVEIRVIEPLSANDDNEKLLEAGRAKARELAAPKAETFQIPEDPTQRYHLWHALDKRQSAGETLAEAERKWWESYPKTTGFRAIQRVMEMSASGNAPAGTRKAM